MVVVASSKEYSLRPASSMASKKGLNDGRRSSNDAINGKSIKTLFSRTTQFVIVGTDSKDVVEL